MLYLYIGAATATAANHVKNQCDSYKKPDIFTFKKVAETV